ncbi:hypothetical protein [Virgibacillus tibetensis]
MNAFEYESIKDQQFNKEFWVNIGALVVIVGAAVICPPAALALGSVYGSLEITTAVSVKDWISGRELNTGERWFRGALAPLDIIPGVAGMKKFSSGVRVSNQAADMGQFGLKAGVKTSIQRELNHVGNLVVEAGKQSTIRLKNAGAVIKETTTSVKDKLARDAAELGRVADTALTKTKNITSTRNIVQMDGFGTVRIPKENTHFFEGKVKDALGKTYNVEVGGIKLNSSVTKSRIEYLRNKYGRLTPEELHSRINMRGINEEAIKQGSKNTWSEFLEVSKSGKRTVEEIKDSYIKLVKEQSPWPEGYNPTKKILQPGDTFEMVLDNAQPLNRPGGFGTYDKIAGVEYAKNNLAIKSEWKEDFGKVVTYRVKKGVELPVLEGPVGPQIDLAADKFLPGGGTQLQLLLDRKVNKVDYLEITSVRPNR